MAKDDISIIEKGFSGQYFPLDYIKEFFLFLDYNHKLIETNLYSDYNWNENYSPVSMYNSERLEFEKKKSNQKIYLNLQFDIDDKTEVLNELLKFLLDKKIKINIMIFNTHIDRFELAKNNLLVLKNYEINQELLKKNKNIEVGYHTNCYELSKYNFKKAIDIFVKDLEVLRLKYDKINYFSPHGGVVCNQGYNNNHISIDENFQITNNIRWVHNKRNLKWDGQYSDGGIAKRDEKNFKKLNLKSFVQSWKLGKRYFLLLHPQYYGADKINNNSKVKINKYQWYKEIWDHYTINKQKKNQMENYLFRRTNKIGKYWGSLKFSFKSKSFY